MAEVSRTLHTIYNLTLNRVPAATVIRNNTTQEAVIIDMGDLSDITNRDNKKQDTLFGPNIGVVTSGPAWTDASKKEKQPVVDQLTPDVVKGWIAKSKEVSISHHPH